MQDWTSRIKIVQNNMWNISKWKWSAYRPHSVYAIQSAKRWSSTPPAPKTSAGIHPQSTSAWWSPCQDRWSEHRSKHESSTLDEFKHIHSRWTWGESHGPRCQSSKQICVHFLSSNPAPTRTGSSSSSERSPASIALFWSCSDSVSWVRYCWLQLVATGSWLWGPDVQHWLGCPTWGMSQCF